MKKILLIDPFHGASGDMLLASLVDAGLDLETLSRQLNGVPVLAEAGISAHKVKRGFFTATRLDINLPHEHAHRGLSQVTEIIESAPGLSPAVKSRAAAAFDVLAGAEATVHGTSKDEVHFHEVGALDAILDIVGFYLAVEQLDVSDMRYTEIVLGSGTTQCQHGEIPLPAPATLELLKGHAVRYSGIKEELVTPTAAAIIASGFTALPPQLGVIAEKIGYGAGTREGEGLPNILRASIGLLEDAAPRVSILRTTIDDMNPEIYGFILDNLLKLGVFDVYYHPVMMKKNRPGLEITVITDEKDERHIADFLLKQTTTLGVRVSREERVEIPRRTENINTDLGEAQVKVGTLPGGGERVSPEYESCKAIAEKTGKPILEVFDVVRRAWENKHKRD